ncbi:MAG: cytochrome c oxidase subunit II [Deltaproteobacteria bacterium]|nr:cytochrome c oxidase subunit II [Deltaproteobacteria bacterium]
MGRFSLLPEQASTVAGQVDTLYFFLVALSAFFSVLIAFVLFAFVIRYRRSRARKVVPTGGGFLALELTWTVIPFILVMIIFGWGARVFVTMRTPPDDAMQVYVVGKQWMWKAQHIEGRREINELHVPVGRPVRLLLTSEDVIHSFYVPAFRVKQDAVPGRYTSMWFEADKVGEYHLFCAEFCGTAHARMIGRIVVMEPAEFQNWLSGGSGSGDMLAEGEKLFEQLGCRSCHQAETGSRGPTLAGLFNKQVQLADGRTVVADDTYLREAILNPQAAVVAGYQPIMPTFKGQVSEESLLQLLAYIKSLQGPKAAGADAAAGSGKAHAMLPVHGGQS